MGIELAVTAFPQINGAERAYATVRATDPTGSWVNEIALVEKHPRDRVVMRGTFGGRYVDVDNLSDPVGVEAVGGALTGAVVGAAFGPAGFTTGLIGGMMLGGESRAQQIPELTGPLFDQLNANIPSGSSAIVLLADSTIVDAMVSALGDEGEETIRRPLSEAAVEALVQCVANVPAAEPGEAL